MSFKWQNIWSKQYQTPQLPAACCTAQQIGSFTLAPCRSSNYYASHCCLLTLELNRRQDEKRAEKRNEKAEEAKEKQIMKWENDVERVHKPEVKKGMKRGKKKGTGQKNRITLNMLIAVAVGEEVRQTGYKPRTVKSKSKWSLLKLRYNSLEVTQPTIRKLLPIRSVNGSRNLMESE